MNKHRELCDYCAESMLDTVYSIPLNDPMLNHSIKWSGSFCCPPCRLSGNRYTSDPPLRSIQNWEEREAYIRQLDLHRADYAPAPSLIRRWNPNGFTRDQWLKQTQNNKIRK